MFSRARTWTAEPLGVLLAALGLSTWAVLVVAYWPFTVDDSYITMRYAENLAQGAGPTWNPDGPRAEGYTSPAWMLLLAGLHALGLGGVVPVKLASCAAALIGLLLTAWLAARLTPSRAALAAGVSLLLLGLLPASAIHAVSGMETTLAGLLVVAHALAALSWLRNARDTAVWWLAGAGLALGLTRPEANLYVFVVGLVLLVQSARERRVPLLRAILLVHVVPGALYFAWRWSYYGLPLPLPLLVKASGTGSPLPGAADCLAFVKERLLLRPDLGLGLSVSVLVARRWLAAPLLGGLAIWLFFCVPEHQMGFDFRYLHPWMPVLAVAATTGLLRLRGLVSRWRGLALVPGLSLALVLPMLNGPLQRSLEGQRAYGHGLERAHARIAEVLARSPRGILASLDAGVLAYHSGWHHLDTWGLNEPSVALQRGARSAEPILARRPDVLVVVSRRAEEFEAVFDYERALWDGAAEVGLAPVASFEFMPDYHLLALAAPDSALAEALREAGRPCSGADHPLLAVE